MGLIIAALNCYRFFAVLFTGVLRPGSSILVGAFALFALLG